MGILTDKGADTNTENGTAEKGEHGNFSLENDVTRIPLGSPGPSWEIGCSPLLSRNNHLDTSSMVQGTKLMGIKLSALFIYKKRAKSVPFDTTKYFQWLAQSHLERIDMCEKKYH